MPSIEYDRAGWTPDLAMEAYQKHQESVGSILHPMMRLKMKLRMFDNEI